MLTKAFLGPTSRERGGQNSKTNVTPWLKTCKMLSLSHMCDVRLDSLSRQLCAGCFNLLILSLELEEKQACGRFSRATITTTPKDSK